MPETVGGTESEYAGTVPTTNTVQPKEPGLLTNVEKLRLSRLTGEEDDTEAPREPGFMYGVDSRYPERKEVKHDIQTYDGWDT